MPRSKRFKKINLTKVKTKKSREGKSEIIQNVHDLIQEYKYIYVVKLKNQRNASLKQLRIKLQPGKILIGKNKLLKVAFNSFSDTKIINTDKISSLLRGERGLIFTNVIPEELNKVLIENSTIEFGREGSISDITYTVEPNTDEYNLIQSAKHYMNKQYPQLESTLKESDDGKIILCEQGLPLTRYQYLIMKYLDIPSVKFEIKPIAHLYNQEIIYYENDNE